MSSSRFPGKVLAPLSGKPIIMHVIDRVRNAVPTELIVVLTSTDASDDPLYHFLDSQGIQVFRGDLFNTFMRFREALKDFPCRNFFRISADSPMFDARLIKQMLPFVADNVHDLVTNVFPRTFAKGLSLELVNSKSFLDIDHQALTDYEREHVTPYFYHRHQEYRIRNIEPEAHHNVQQEPCAVDTIEDLRRLESLWKDLESKTDE